MLMRTVRKRHRDAYRALRFCRSALKLTLIFGALLFLVMGMRLILTDFPETDEMYLVMLKDAEYITSGIYLVFLTGSVIAVAVIYYLFKKKNVSTRMFRVSDLFLVLFIEVAVLAVLSYLTYGIPAGGL